MDFEFKHIMDNKEIVNQLGFDDRMSLFKLCLSELILRHNNRDLFQMAHQILELLHPGRSNG